MGIHFLSPRVLRDRDVGERMLRKWQRQHARRAWLASIRGFLVRLIFFGSLGIVLLGLALLGES
jgi:hypothetical protein